MNNKIQFWVVLMWSIVLIAFTASVFRWLIIESEKAEAKEDMFALAKPE